jgi:hypothetical protein
MRNEKDLLLQKLTRLAPLAGMDENYQGATTELSKPNI